MSGLVQSVGYSSSIQEFVVHDTSSQLIRNVATQAKILGIESIDSKKFMNAMMEHMRIHDESDTSKAFNIENIDDCLKKSMGEKMFGEFELSIKVNKEKVYLESFYKKCLKKDDPNYKPTLNGSYPDQQIDLIIKCSEAMRRSVEKIVELNSIFIVSSLSDSKNKERTYKKLVDDLYSYISKVHDSFPYNINDDIRGLITCAMEAVIDNHSKTLPMKR